jgi:predicted nuclease of restriction endonuclease-like (RecB) superfamily
MAIDRNRRPKPGRHDVPLPADYRVLLTDVKSRIRAAQLRASLSVNQELIQLYWDIGRLIVHRQQAEGWGAGVIDRLASDVQKAFPGLEGFRQVIFRA